MPQDIDPTFQDLYEHVQAGSIGDRLREYREIRGLSIVSLARSVKAEYPEIAIDGSYLSRMERGKVSIPLRTLAAICAVLGARLSDIFGKLEDGGYVEIMRQVDHEMSGYVTRLFEEVGPRAFLSLMFDSMRVIRNAREAGNHEGGGRHQAAA